MYMTTLDDIRFDQQRIAYLERISLRNAENMQKKALAEQTALSSHPVVKYVLNLPVEDPRFPAISDHRFAEGESDGQERTQERSPPKRNYIQWCMPGHDQERPREKGCGFIRASDGSTVFTACPEDYEHHIKAKKKHCWSLRCPVCMNDTALKKGIAVERQLLTYAKLSEKEGIRVGNIGHWVISPPQEFMKDAMQSFGPYDKVCRYIEYELSICGATAGYTVFHPWRQRDDRWELSPHFHTLLYGYINTKKFLKDNPGWIIKKVHARQRIRSIRHTVAYLMTHMGLGTVVNEPEDIDWDLYVMDHFEPIISPTGKYTEKDYNDLSEGRGRMCGDCSDIDWVEWTKDRLTRDLRVRYWGGASYKNIVRIDNYRQYKMRVCEECGAYLRTYDGFSDSKGDYVRYIQDNAIYSFARNRLRAKEFFVRYKDRFREGSFTKADLAAQLPIAVCTLELDVPRNNDPVMEGPFDEPDSFFENRQKKAFGEVSL
jgi:hypothetical protein